MKIALSFALRIKDTAEIINNAVILNEVKDPVVEWCDATEYGILRVAQDDSKVLELGDAPCHDSVSTGQLMTR